MRRVGLRIPNEIDGRYTMDDVVELVRHADELGYHSAWVPEDAARNSFMVLGSLADATENIGLGSGIVNVYSRSPALIAMSAATLDDCSDGRALLGLGASSRPAIERWHGMPFDRPLRRLRETIEIVDRAHSADRVDYRGEIFDVDDYPTRLGAPRRHVPVYNAALGPANRRLTGEFADGWLPLHVPFERFPEYVDEIDRAATEAGRDPDDVTVAPYVVSCVSEADPERARELVRGVLSFYVGRMAYYARVFEQFGFADEVAAVSAAWDDGGSEAAREAIGDELLDSVAIAGDPAAGRRRLDAYYDQGVDVPIVAIPATAPPEFARETIEALGPQ